MPPDQQLASSAMERLVVQEIGVKLTGILKENTPGRICGLLTARGRSSEWETALEHIGEHFGPLPGKPKHSIFGRKLRHPDTIKDYIKRAASAPSLLRMSKLTDELGQPTGRPCLLIVREFRENVGEQPEQTCLIIVADFQGKLITAFPATPAQAGLGRPAEVG
jgi:hypothetical protein